MIYYARQILGGVAHEFYQSGKKKAKIHDWSLKFASRVLLVSEISSERN